MDLVNERYTRLTVLRLSDYRRYGDKWWHCRCDCGRDTCVRQGYLRSGRVRSCGCLRNETTGNRRRTHGQATPLTREYRTWQKMKARCSNLNARDYQRYGGRGITVSPEWRESFETFFADMGPRPSSAHSIDRIDNDGPYSRENCRWATRVEQAKNKRLRAPVSYGGETLTQKDWSRRLGGHDGLVRKRLRGGWDIKEAVTLPPGVERSH